MRVRRRLADGGRAGSYARGKARREQYALVREQWRLLGLCAVAGLVPAAVMVWFIPSRFGQGLVVGSSVAAVAGLVAFTVVQLTGTAPVMMGDLAEQWTAQALRPLQRRGWRLVNHFPLSAAGDLDHVLLGRDLVVIETKWSSKPWQVDPPEDRVLQAVAQAASQAKRLSWWAPVHRAGIPVRAMVVLWGAGTSAMPGDGVRWVGDVAVLAGPHLARWRDDLGSADVRPGTRHADVWTAIVDHAQRRDRHEADEFPLPPSVGQLLGKVVLGLTAAVAAVLLTARIMVATSSLWLTGLIAAVLLLPALAWIKARRARYMAWPWLITTPLLPLATSVYLLWTRVRP